MNSFYDLYIQVSTNVGPIVYGDSLWTVVVQSLKDYNGENSIILSS